MTPLVCHVCLWRNNGVRWNRCIFQTALMLQFPLLLFSLCFYTAGLENSWCPSFSISPLLFLKSVFPRTSVRHRQIWDGWSERIFFLMQNSGSPVMSECLIACNFALLVWFWTKHHKCSLVLPHPKMLILGFLTTQISMCSIPEMALFCLLHHGTLMGDCYRDNEKGLLYVFPVYDCILRHNEKYCERNLLIVGFNICISMLSFLL